MVLFSSRSVAICQALLVCFVWSTSFVITKELFGYQIGPLTLTGLRYGLAALVLAPLATAVRTSHGDSGGERRWLFPVLLGVAGYGLNPAGQNVALSLLSAGQVAVLLTVGNCVQVLFWGWLLLGERPDLLQLAMIAVATGGVVVFGWPASGGDYRPAGVLAVVAGGLGYALWLVGNRALVAGGSAVRLACRSMLFGAVPLLGVGFAVEGPPRLPWTGWSLLVLLAAVNTALAFALWTHTQRHLTSYESVTINNTMTMQIAVLAAVFLGEALDPRQWCALLVVTGATVAVQVMGARRRR